MWSAESLQGLSKALNISLLTKLTNAPSTSSAIYINISWMQPPLATASYCFYQIRLISSWLLRIALHRLQRQDVTDMPCCWLTMSQCMTSLLLPYRRYWPVSIGLGSFGVGIDLDAMLGPFAGTWSQHMIPLVWQSASAVWSQHTKVNFGSWLASSQCLPSMKLQLE